MNDAHTYGKPVPRHIYGMGSDGKPCKVTVFAKWTVETSNGRLFKSNGSQSILVIIASITYKPRFSPVAAPLSVVDLTTQQP